MTSTIQEKVKCALENGKALTSATISNRYGAGNPGAVIQAPVSYTHLTLPTKA